ncbi:rhomboid family intramembrane serine protease [Nocardia sp. CDC159]|uniref:Rhomboid family intramembrane serine protease n=1 Tax=Nocardia pulmonis TaxID=2951408 RepID=A0A9X2J0T7_9NOCA|nr:MULTISPECIES: rhomboid family intramembrane serine protease [Nocardia]MCM6778164.1 rhomboid family intramembrane serine protease [Nocardia pulmonis]MCM6791053.1 rhomboid family intramembrane serine protease [Nocardia sp. CDC159]
MAVTAGMGSFDPDRIAALRGRTGRSAVPRPPGSSSAVKLLWQRAIALTLGFVALLYGIEGVDTLANHQLDNAGVQPRKLDGLEGIAFAPVLHGDWAHLIGNTVPVLVLGLLTLLTGIGRGLAATAIIWILGGAGQWLTGDTGSVHLGASVLVFGWLTYLISRGWFARNPWQILLGVVVGLLYGSILWGVLPGQPGISWQGHLFGALGGVVAAWVLSGNERRHRRGDNVGRLASSG